MTTPLRTARSLLALFALLCAGYVGARANAQKRRAAETEVLRALLDSAYSYILPGSIPRARELLLTDHFDELHGWYWIDSVAHWVADTLPDVSRDLIRDFSRVAPDQSRIEPFELGRSKLHLLADSTLGRFFRRAGSGWDGFYRAFPNGGAIVSVSRVGLSRDCRWAMVYAGSQGDWLAGAGYLYVLEKHGGVWHERRRLMLWIS